MFRRDLKPGNILVTRDTERPVPKVIDFGVAKAVDPSDAASLRTAEGQRLGTLRVKLDDKPVTDHPLIALDAVEQAGFIGRTWDTLQLWFKR